MKILAFLLLLASPVLAQSNPEVAIPGFTVSASASAPAVKTNTESYSAEVLANGEVEVSLRAAASMIRQGKAIGALTVTVGNESQTVNFTGGAAQVVVPAIGNVRVTITVTLSAFVGLGSASITMDDVYLTVR